MMQEMTREKFYVFAADEIRNYIPEEYNNIQIIDVNNSRGNYKGMTAKKKTAGTVSVSPVVNLDRFYAHYIEGTQLEEIFKEMTKIITMTPPKSSANLADYIFDWELIKDKLFVSVTNAAKVNTKVFKKVAGDVVMIARILVNSDSRSIATAVVQEPFIDKWGKTQDEVFEYALNNSRELMGVSFQNLGDMFQLAEAPEVRVVSNRNGQCGAAVVFYPGVAQEVSERLGGDFYILPSSIHEVLCLAGFGPTAQELKDLVKSVNETVVDPDEVLSNKVFYYDSKKKTFKEV